MNPREGRNWGEPRALFVLRGNPFLPITRKKFEQLKKKIYIYIYILVSF
jgi:hypothetical protein